MGAADLLDMVVEKLGLPLVVKPAGQGSALGIKVVRKAEELPQALIFSLSYDERVFVEKYIKGKEISVSILGEEVLPPVEIVPKKEFFDYEAMYTMGMTDYYIPARLSQDELEKVMEISLQCHRSLNCEPLSRVDLIYEEESKTPYILEINTSPGMTDTSLLPLAAEASGLSFNDLVEKIISLSWKKEKVQA
jgi:D-alanine-D-alanine ligase